MEAKKSSKGGIKMPKMDLSAQATITETESFGGKPVDNLMLAHKIAR